MLDAPKLQSVAFEIRPSDTRVGAEVLGLALSKPLGEQLTRRSQPVSTAFRWGRRMAGPVGRTTYLLEAIEFTWSIRWDGGGPVLIHRFMAHTCALRWNRRSRCSLRPKSTNSGPQAALYTQWPGGPGVPGNPAFDQFYASQLESIASTR
jgi:hypothetical protein